MYVTSYPVAGARTSISIDGGDSPVWAPSGASLYFRSGSRLLRVPVTSGTDFSAGLPELIVEAELTDYDIGPDERVYAVLPHGPRGWDRLHVIDNWCEELRHLAPTDN